jgi:hypothetical protein
MVRKLSAISYQLSAFVGSLMSVLVWVASAQLRAGFARKLSAISCQLSAFVGSLMSLLVWLD